MLRQFALLLAVALPALGQVKETIEVSITSVDVVVTDGKGNRVRGLTRDDFEVLVAGKPQEITNFSEYTTPGSGPAAPAIAPATPGGAPAAAPDVSTPPLWRVLMIIDNNTLTLRNRRTAMAAAQEFVEKNVRRGDLVMIATLGGSFTPRTEWTTARYELQRVLGKIGEEANIGRIEQDRRKTEQEIDRMVEMASTPGRALRYRFADLMAVGRTYAERSLQDARHSIALLSAVVNDVSRFREKKAVIFIGEGLDAQPGWDMFQRLETIKMQVDTGQTGAAMRGTTRDFSPINEAGRYSTSGALYQFAGVAYRKGVPIYAINPGMNEDAAGAVERTSLADHTAEFANVISKMAGYQVVATMSGGAAFIGQRPDRALAQIGSDLGSYYSLGFRASAGSLKNPGSVRVKTRHGYRVRMVMAGVPESAEEKLGEAVVAHHVLPPAGNELQIALATQPGVAVGEKKQIKLLVMIPVRQLALVRQGAEFTGGFDVYLSIGDGTGKTSGVNKQTHTIRWPAEALPQLLGRNLTYAVDVTLEPGSNQISVGVVDHGSKKTGFERVGV